MTQFKRSSHKKMPSAWDLIRFGSMLYVVNTYIFEVTMCVGPSMKPTFNEAGDIVVVEHMSPLMRRLKVNDVVICQSPLNPKQTVCKRIKAMEGEKVKIQKRFSHDGSSKEIVIPKGRVWVEGDNPSNSTDSRSYGPVPYALLKGKVILKLWPLNELGVVR